MVPTEDFYYFDQFVAPSLFLREFHCLEAVFLLQRLRNSCLVVGSPLANKFDLDRKDRALRLDLSYVGVSPCHLPKFRLQES
jgi:hypothetical protein